MKAFVVLFAACLLIAVEGLTEEQKAKLKRHHSECLSETGVELSLIQKVRLGDYKIENEDLKKFALCTMIKSELMTKEGKFKKDVALAKVPIDGDKAAVEKAIDACLAIKGNTPEQSAWNYVKCYHEKNPKHPIL